ncbi:MAG: AMP-binding protein [Bacteroidales bacterium]
MNNYESQSGITLNGRWHSRRSLSEPGVHPELDDPLVRKVLEFLHQWFDDTQGITLFTSGSTGPPKKVILPKKAMMASAEMTGRFFKLKPGMTAHLCLSPDFVAGKMLIVRALAHGMDLLTTHVGANPLEALTQDVDFSAMVPLQVANVLKHNPEKMEQVSILIIGGGAVSPLLEQQLMHLKTNCWHTYGMTETLSHIALRPMNGPERSDWFTPLPGVEVSADPRGCLVINAPAIIPEKVVTNDLVLVKNNRFQVLGRKDDVIISAGHKLHPAVIEQKIGSWLSSPFFLAGEQHPSAGQIPVLFVEAPPRENQKQQIQEHLEQRLDPYEVPRKVIMLDRFVYLESGKINRQATQDLYYSSR